MSSSVLAITTFSTIATIIAVVVILASWSRRRLPGGAEFIYLMSSVALWSTAAAFEILAASLTTKIFWIKIQYIGACSLPVFWLLFAVRYTQQDRWFTLNKVRLLFVIPAITLALTASNEYHGLMWKSAVLAANSYPGSILYLRGAWFWVYILFAYSSILGGAVILIRAALQMEPTQRAQPAALIVGVAIPFLGNMIYVSGLSPLPGLDLTPISFSISGLICAWSLFGLRLLDLAPVARTVLIENMADAVVVLDTQGRIVDSNPAAQRLLLEEAGFVIGHYAAGVLKIWPQIANLGLEGVTEALEMRLAGNANCFLEVQITPIFSGYPARQTGRLLTARDITNRKLASAEIERLKRFNESILNQMVEGIAVQDEAGYFLYLNPAALELLGYTASDLEKLHWTDIVPPDQRPIVAAANERRLSGQSDRYEVEVIRKDGRRIPVQVAGMPHRHPENGRITGTLAVFVDISSIKESEKNLQRNLEQQKLLYNSLQLLFRSQDTEQVIEAVLARCGEFVDVERAFISRVRLNRLQSLHTWHALAAMSPNGSFADIDLRQLFSCQQLIENQGMILAEDISSLPGDIAALLQKRAVRSVLIFPILIQNALQGCIGFETLTRTHVWEPQEIELLQTVANLIAQAMERQQAAEDIQHFYQTEQQRVRELEALQALTTDISSEIDLPRLLQATMHHAMTLLNTQVGQLAIWDENETRLQIVLSTGTANDHTGERRALGEGLLGKVAQLRAPYQVDDYGRWEGRSEIYRDASGYTVLGVPLLSGNRLLGVIGIGRPKENGEFSPRDVNLFTLFAQQAAIAIQNARLYETAQREILERETTEAALLQANERLIAQLDEIEVLQESLREQAVRDALTGLYNRRYLEETLPREIARARRLNQPVSLVMLDIDRFKNLNDTYGHTAGDKVLQSLSQLLRERTRASDIACRYGGEEFIIVMPGADLADAALRADAWRRAFGENTAHIDGYEITSTLSAGVAVYPQNGDTIDVLLKNVDLALYAAKAIGRNCTQTVPVKT